MSDVRSNPSEVDNDMLPRGVPNLVGTLVDNRYQIGSVLGAGGMGAVFEAQDMRLSRRVALKVLKPTLMHRDDYVERFKREARTASNIRHPNVVGIFDYGSMPDGTVYTVMELLVGEDLSTRLKRVGRMPWPASRWILVQIVRALHAAHSQGVIHRDIKPANCFLMGAEGQELVKVLDFGIAKLDQLEEGDRALTGTSEILGTPSYMAPEMARGITADARSEVYSIGVLAYRMLGGQVPFDGNNAFDVLLQHATQAPPPLQSKAPDLPPKVVELVHDLLHKDPGSRPQTMAVVEQLLLSLDDNGQPCNPATQSVYPVAPSSGSASGMNRGQVGSGIHPTPSGAIGRPPTPGPMARDPAAPGNTMPPPGGGGPPRGRPLGPPPKPPSSFGRPPSPPKRRPGASGPNPAAPSKPEGLGTAKTMFATAAPPGRPGRTPAFSKPAAPKLGRPGAPPSPPGTSPPKKPGSPAPKPAHADDIGGLEDRTMLAQAPLVRPSAPGNQPSATATLPPSTAPTPSYPESGIDRTMMVDAPFARPKAPSTATPAPAPTPSYPESGVDRTMMVDAPFARPKDPSAATPAPTPSYPESGIDRTMMVDAPFARPKDDYAAAGVDRTMIHPPAGEDPVDRTMIHPHVGEDLADRTMIHPPSAAMGGMNEDDPFGGAGADRTMILDSGNEPLELDANDVMQVSDGGTQVVDINEVNKAAALAAIGIQAPPAGPHGFGPGPGPEGQMQPGGPNNLLHSSPSIDAYEEEPEQLGGGRWVVLALVGALIAIGAGGLVAYMLFADDSTEETAKADETKETTEDVTKAGDGTPAADDGTPADDDDGAAADDGTPAADDGTPAADDGADGADGAADDGTPAADDGDDGAAADDDGGDDGADDGAGDGDDDGAEPEPEPETKTKTKPKPESTEPAKPRGPAPDGTVKNRVAKAAAKKCSPGKKYTVSFIIGPEGTLKLPSVSPRDSTGDCILGIVRKAKFRTRPANTRDQLTVQ